MPKTIIITGGAKGIGRAIALKFAETGANIVLNYRSETPSALIEQLEKMGVKCHAVKADVSFFEEAEELVQSAKERFGQIDVCVNNAGITRDALLIRMKENEFDDVIDTNLKGVFNMLRHVSPIMIKQKSGCIINMSSVVGEIGNIGQTNYAASKAGVIGLTKAAARELAMRGITCNAIAPGFIESDMTAGLPEEIKQKMLDNTPLKRFGKPEEVAKLALFLSEMPYITGQVINIDGGMVM